MGDDRMIEATVRFHLAFRNGRGQRILFEVLHKVLECHVLQTARVVAMAFRDGVA
jgi:hypothetical protein